VRYPIFSKAAPALKYSADIPPIIVLIGLPFSSVDSIEVGLPILDKATSSAK
jgi:hypothetical protein